MTTLKLKTNLSPAQEGKKPVRRADPSKRDRTKPQPKPTAPSDVVGAEDSAQPARNSTHTRHRENKEAGKSEGARQRNHRFDGRLRDADEPHYRQAPRRQGKLRDAKERDNLDVKAKHVSVETSIKSTNSDLPRLSKLMAERGLCSRREADEWIENGWVKVNGEIIETLGTRVSPDAEIVISSYAKEYQAENVTILLHKPIGYVSGQAEDGYEPAVVLIKPENEWQEGVIKKDFQRRFLKDLAPAGRLDIDSTGLLVLTQDGRIAKQLIGENSTIEKEYLVRVEGELSESGLKKLNFGLSLDGVQLKPAKVSWQNENQLRFVLREGRKRQIRRMCELVGLKVVGLKRVRIGSITLGKLPLGQWRYLKPNERF